MFADLLGFIGPASGLPVYTLKRESLIQVDGKFADAGLGRFPLDGSRPEFIAVLEGKGPSDPLDRPFAGRKRSAVEQALSYAVNLEIDWYLVTNLKETRLYHKGHDQFTFERFDTRALAVDDAALRKFIFLLGAERLIPPTGRTHLDGLLADSQRVGVELTRDYYREYAALRRRTFEQIRADNPEVPATELLSATQKMLDRVLFIAFCEHRGLLPADTIARAFRHADPYNPRPIWDNFKGLFRAVNEGNRLLGIECYNGGLFAPDTLLERLIVPDEVCRGLDKLAAYDYRSPTAADEEAPAGAARLVDVEVLGHIFEQSISDLEELHQELASGGRQPPEKRR